MTHEGAPQVDTEAAQLQDPDLVMVGCKGGQELEHHTATWGEFKNTEHGQKMVGDIESTANLLETTGLSKDEAMIKALSTIALKDEVTNEVIFAPAPEEQPKETLESKIDAEIEAREEVAAAIDSQPPTPVLESAHAKKN